MSLLKELRRRSVFKVGVAYVALGWSVLTVADILVPALHLPDWIMSLLILLIVIGLPIAVFLAWAYELSPEGIRPTQPAPDDKPLPARSPYDWVIIGLLLVAIALFALDMGPRWAETDTTPGDTPIMTAAPESAAPANDLSIAVMPFTNLSGQAEQEHFADGLAEEVRNLLSAVRDLRVTSRRSSSSFKDSDATVADIARQLNVAYVLEGSVRRAGSQLRISAQLIDPTSDSHLWSDNFDRDLTPENLFAVQEGIATTVVSTLRSKLMPSGGGSLLADNSGAGGIVPRGIVPGGLPDGEDLPSNLNAVDYFFRATSALEDLTGDPARDDETLANAVSLLEASTLSDPTWGVPVAWLGRAYQVWSQDGRDRSKVETSRGYVRSALDRAPNLAVTQQSLAFLEWVDGDFAAALSSLDRAEALGADVHQQRGRTLLSMGRVDDALLAFERALAVDPLSPGVRLGYANALQCRGRHDEALAQLAAGPITAHSGMAIHALSARSHARLGHRDETLERVAQIDETLHSNATMADALALIGETDRAAGAIDELEAANDELSTAAAAALILGDEDRGLRLVEAQAAAMSVPGRTDWLFCTPEIRGLAGNARYDAILASHGLRTP